MGDKCPYCKADLEFTVPYGVDDGIYKRWRCGSTDSWRSTKCYERQLTAQKELIRRTAEIVKGIAVGTCLSEYSHTLRPEFIRKAQALLPELEKAGKE